VDEVLHASFFGHAYPVHSHASWTVLIMDAGEVRYGLDKHDRAADMDRVTILPPHVPHDGHSARPGRGFKKRVLYVDTNTIPESLVGHAVDRSAVNDPGLRRSISQLHHALLQPENDLEWESLLSLAVERICWRLSANPTRDATHNSEAASALRDHLDSRPFERHDLSMVAAKLGWNKTHLIRSFTASFGLPPHRYLIGRRVDEARRLLLDEMPPAAVASAVGFHDQAHLTRHFRNYLDTTPGRFQKSAGQIKR
jgi:AraC-like DNA-binding protein